MSKTKQKKVLSRRQAGKKKREAVRIEMQKAEKGGLECGGEFSQGQERGIGAKVVQEGWGG